MRCRVSEDKIRFPRRRRGERILPLHPVYSYLSYDPGGDGEERPSTPRAALVWHLVDICGIENRKTAASRVERWLASGISWSEADVLAVSLGYHPVEIWKDWYAVS